MTTDEAFEILNEQCMKCGMKCESNCTGHILKIALIEGRVEKLKEVEDEESFLGLNDGDNRQFNGYRGLKSHRVGV